MCKRWINYQFMFADVICRPEFSSVRFDWFKWLWFKLVPFSGRWWVGGNSSCVPAQIAAPTRRGLGWTNSDGRCIEKQGETKGSNFRSNVWINDRYCPWGGSVVLDHMVSPKFFVNIVHHYAFCLTIVHSGLIAEPVLSELFCTLTGCQCQWTGSVVLMPVPVCHLWRKLVCLWVCVQSRGGGSEKSYFMAAPLPSFTACHYWVTVIFWRGQ